MIDKFKQLDEYDMFKFIFSNKKVQDYIIELNTIEQLYEKGINSEGISLSSIDEYNPFTIQDKLNKGLPTNRVTLFNSGDLYNSIYVRLSKDYIEIVSVLIDEYQLEEKYGDNILGLSKDSLDKLVKFIIPYAQLYVEKKLNIR